MRTLLLFVALLAILFSPLALSRTNLESTPKTTIKMTSSVPGVSLHVTVSYGTDSDGNQTGSIQISESEDQNAPWTKFSYLSYGADGLEAYWTPPTPGITITFGPNGSAFGSITLANGQQVNLKKKK